jgi:CheY-like chemotaxis protein
MPNILVVDDEPDVLAALGRALRLAGYQVSEARTAEAAIEVVRQLPLDLVVLDYIMPAMTGIELLNRIRGIQPTIRSIIVSGKLDSDVSEEAVVAELRESIEADAYLHKPLDNEKLVESIQQILAQSESRDWKQIAERNLKAKKRVADVKNAERGINRHRSGKRK